MAHCTKCGALVAENTPFCGSCGASQSAQSSQSSGNGSAAAHPDMAENVAGTLCYALGWITGLIFYFIDKRPTVRFHATQSIVVFGGLQILSMVLGTFFGMSLFAGGWTGFSLGYALFHLIQLVGVVLWILLMIKAYQGERFRVPFAADLAEKLFEKA
jgi:uncharacterized membrane protein